MALVTNGLSAVQKQHWANATQRNLYKTLTCLDFAEIIDIPNGTIKNLPYVQMQSTTNYTRYQVVDFKQINTGNDQLILNETPMVPFNIDDLDVEDDYINIIPEVTENASYKIKERWDGQFFNEVIENAKWKVDANGVGLNTWTLTPAVLVSAGPTQNISSIFGNAKAVLTNTWVNANRIKLAIDSFTEIQLSKLGLTVLGDVAVEDRVEVS